MAPKNPAAKPGTRSIAEKLLLKPPQAMWGESLGELEPLLAGIPRAKTAGEAAALVLLAENVKQLESRLAGAVKKLGREAGQRLWVVYPKAGQRGTDLNRDRLHERAVALGLRGVRQIALDEVWSALAFALA